MAITAKTLAAELAAANLKVIEITEAEESADAEVRLEAGLSVQISGSALLLWKNVEENGELVGLKLLLSTRSVDLVASVAEFHVNPGPNVAN